MKFIDNKFKNNKKQYILQCLMATVALMIILFSVDLFMEAAVVASIGATSFILFTMPHTKRSKPRYIIGGYVVGIVSGILTQLVFISFDNVSHTIIGGIAVGICMFLMVTLNFEHPPAAAMAFSVAIDGYDLKLIVFVFVVLFALRLVVYLNRKWFIDLL